MTVIVIVGSALKYTYNAGCYLRVCIFTKLELFTCCTEAAYYIIRISPYYIIRISPCLLDYSSHVSPLIAS